MQWRAPKVRERPVSDSNGEELRARALADESLRSFMDAMHAAGDPGASVHHLGSRHRGWVLDYDAVTGGAKVRVIIGVDGFVYAPRGPMSQRSIRSTASAWLFREESPIEPMYRALAFSYCLSEIRHVHHVPD